MRQAAILFFASAVLAFAAPAQDYTWDQVDELGIKYQVYKKLKRIPLKLGDAHPNMRARYEPGADGDYIWGRYGKFRWHLQVFEFGDPTSGPKTGAESTATEPPSRVKSADEARTFRDFVTSNKDPENKDRQFRVKGEDKKANKARGKKLPYTWWEYTDKHSMVNGYGEQFEQLWQKYAAVYQIDGREIAVVTDMPIKKGDQLDSKYRAWCMRMLLSVTMLKDGEAESEPDSADEELYEYADTPERHAAVDGAKANIANLDTWGIFTTPNYIVLYSWPPKSSPSKQRRYLTQAKDIADDMDEMRELYMENYPPPDTLVFPYSVMRICSTQEEFHKYGDTNYGVAGWFSPQTKELVLFNDREISKAVAFHEGWHQYSDSYFPGVELHRWFDEGTGDYFGSYERKGKRWEYDVSRMRKADIKTIVNTEDYVPLSEIVSWNKDKFYGNKAANYYAQGYSMVDFLRRGKQNRGLWDPAWDNILDIYRQQLLETKNQKKSIEAAFAQVDWAKMTKAWVAWVKSY